MTGCTILHRNEHITNTSSNLINDLITRVNKYLPYPKYIVREYRYKQKKWFFSRSNTVVYYSVFYIYNEGDEMVQELTLDGTYSSIVNYLNGVENGLSENLKTN